MDETENMEPTIEQRILAAKAGAFDAGVAQREFVQAEQQRRREAEVQAERLSLAFATAESALKGLQLAKAESELKSLKSPDLKSTEAVN